MHRSAEDPVPAPLLSGIQEISHSDLLTTPLCFGKASGNTDPRQIRKTKTIYDKGKGWYRSGLPALRQTAKP